MCEQLSSLTASHLEVLSGGRLRLVMSVDGGSLRISKAAWVRDAGGAFRERTLGQLSGGQWRRCALALNLAFVDLARRRGAFRGSALVLDEPITHLDGAGREAVAARLRELCARPGAARGPADKVDSLFVVLQDTAAEDFGEAFDACDVVSRRGDASVVLQDEDKA